MKFWLIDLLYLPAFVFYGIVHIVHRFVVWFITDTTDQYPDDPGL